MSTSAAGVGGQEPAARSAPRVAGIVTPDADAGSGAGPSIRAGRSGASGAPKAWGPLRELQIDVVLNSWLRFDGIDATKHIGSRQLVGQHNHLADDHAGRQAHDRALREHDHRARFFPHWRERLAQASPRCGVARGVHDHGNLDADGIGSRRWLRPGILGSLRTILWRQVGSDCFFCTIVMMNVLALALTCCPSLQIDRIVPPGCGASMVRRYYQVSLMTLDADWLIAARV